MVGVLGSEVGSNSFTGSLDRHPWDYDDVAAATTALIVSLGLRVTRATNGAEAKKVLQTPGLGDEIGFMLPTWACRARWMMWH